MVSGVVCHISQLEHCRLSGDFQVSHKKNDCYPKQAVQSSRLCSPLGSGIDEYVSVTRHRKHF